MHRCRRCEAFFGVGEMGNQPWEKKIYNIYILYIYIYRYIHVHNYKCNKFSKKKIEKRINIGSNSVSLKKKIKNGNNKKKYIFLRL